MGTKLLNKYICCIVGGWMGTKLLNKYICYIVGGWMGAKRTCRPKRSRS